MGSKITFGKIALVIFPFLVTVSFQLLLLAFIEIYIYCHGEGTGCGLSSRSVMIINASAIILLLCDLIFFSSKISDKIPLRLRKISLLLIYLVPIITFSLGKII